MMRFLRSYCGMALYVTNSTYKCIDIFLGKTLKEVNEDECKQYFDSYVTTMKKARKMA